MHNILIPFLHHSHPNKKHLFSQLNIPPKSLGDKPYLPKNQSLGTYAPANCAEELEVFEKLASAYVVGVNGGEGEGGRWKMCEVNAQVRFLLLFFVCFMILLVCMHID
jgi:hypothetical protein